MNPRVKGARIWTLGALATVAVVAGGLSSAHGAGLLIADGGLGGVLEIQEHAVQVTINNGVAVTEVTQVFLNTENRQVEALYTFPVPKQASVAGFSMWIGGKEMVGEVVEKEKAREIYDSYRRVRRDPGLLEQTDYKTFEMRIFPIAPKAQQKVRITYYQELDYDNDWVTYVYPLATQSRREVASKTTGRFGFNLQVKSAVPIVKLESPSHGERFAIAKHEAALYQASLETKSGDLNKDVVVAYHVSRPHTGVDLVASRHDGEDGYFCLTMTAGEELTETRGGMDYVFILDCSGSMADDNKLGLSRGAVAAFVNALGTDDRFEVLAFNVTASPLFNALHAADAGGKSKAAAFMDSQQARGGTVLKPALEAAYRYAAEGRTLNVLVLSDGMTEQGERAALLEMIAKRPKGSRVFCIGVGNDVNRLLLEQLAEDAGGLAAFISPSDNFERQAQSFRRKLMHPAATNLRIELAGVDVYDLEPTKLPDLFHGMPVRLYGRYRGAGPVKVNVRAEVAGGPIATALEAKLPKAEEGNPEIERMWAWHKVQRLLKEGDRVGSHDQVKGEIVRLGEGYSIATQYTSFLVLENDAEYQRWRIVRSNVRRMERDREQQQKLLAEMDAIRTKAAAGLGPENGQVDATKAGGQQVTSAAPVQDTSNGPGDVALRPHGGGPIGPFGVVGIGALAVLEWRRRRRAAK